MKYCLGLTESIETIIDNVIYSGEPQELRVMENGTSGDPYVWLSADWCKDSKNFWVIEVNFLYSDTGRVAYGNTIPETRLCEEEYNQYREDLRNTGSVDIEKYFKNLQ